MKNRRRLKKALLFGVVLFLLLNGVAYRHAYTMTHFARGGARTKGPAELTLRDRLAVLARGPRFPRPENERTPKSAGLDFETWRIPVHGPANGNDDVQLEAWYLRPPGPAADRRRVVVLFHGYADRKLSVLAEARAFLRLGFEAVLVDFRGSGGSSEDVTSIGFHEAEDVVAAVTFTKAQTHGPLTVWGVSMGGAAALRAVGALNLAVDRLIVEAPFSTLKSAVVNRFHGLGVPALPGLPELLIYWGGQQQGFNGFFHNPATYARTVRVPTLLLLGEEDQRVLMPEGRDIFESLGGVKTFETFPGLGHVSLLRGDRERWMRTVGTFMGVPEDVWKSAIGS